MQESTGHVREAGEMTGAEVAALREAVEAVKLRFDEIAETVGASSGALAAISTASSEVAAAAGEAGRASGEVLALAGRPQGGRGPAGVAGLTAVPAGLPRAPARRRVAA